VTKEPSAAEASAGRYPRWIDVLGVLWIVVAACAALVPTLVHGSTFGEFDFLSKYGLTSRPGVFIHNGAAADQTDEVLPWITLAWTQVHHGHLPLWNPYEALGMPLAFNFGSGAFSFPALVSYLTPVRIIYWVQIVVSLVVGGTGAYFLGRVLRLHPVACVFAGTTWVLSGPFFGYLGLPDTSVMSWMGWQFAAAVLILRGTRRLLSVLLFAVSLAFSFLAGNPQIEILILVALFIFVAVVLLFRSGPLRGSGPIRRPVGDLILAFVAGCALSAPLLLPGIQLADASIRKVAPSVSANPVSQVLGLLFQKFWGQPIAGSFINPQGFYQEQWVYVGAIAVALAIVALGMRGRRPEVVGLAVAAVAVAVASVSAPVERLLGALPIIGHSLWSRALIPLAFCVAMLAGIGLDAALQQRERQRAIRWTLGSFGTIAVILGLVWLFGRGALPAYAAHIRAESFVWPVVSTATGLAAFGTLAMIERRPGEKPRRQMKAWTFGVAGSLLICQTVFLVSGDSNIFSSSSTPYQPTPAVVALQRAAGTSLVGLGEGNETLTGGLGLGLGPNTNIPFGIHEFAEYDPIAPSTYFSAWKSLNGTSPGLGLVFYFTPAIDTAAIARRYGISYVLERRGAAGPTGSVFDTRVGNEDLYRIPGAATATLVPAATSSRWPSIDARGTAVHVEWPGPSAARIETKSSTAQVLRLRVASFPGWQATIDGRPLALSTYAVVGLQARIPAGKHIIELHYWPKDFTEGIALAAVTVATFGVVAIVTWRRKTTRGFSPEPTS